MPSAHGARDVLAALVAAVASASCAGDDGGGSPPATTPVEVISVTTPPRRPIPSSAKPAAPSHLPGPTAPPAITPSATAPATTTPATASPGTAMPATTPVSAAPPSAATGATGYPLPSSDQPRIAAAIFDLAERIGVDAATIAVADFRDVTWADGSLGCPRPDMSYIQRLTPGLLLVLTSGDGTRHEYHGGPKGDLAYCATPRPPIEDRGGGS